MLNNNGNLIFQKFYHNLFGTQKGYIYRYSLILCIKLLTNTNTVHSCKCAYTFDVSKMMSEHETRRMHKNDFNDMQTRFPILKHF